MSIAREPLLSPRVLSMLERLELEARKPLRGHSQGERRSRRRGRSAEFADFRPYVAGDDLRFLDWNGSARLDRLFSKLYLDEEDVSLYLLLDISRSMGFGEPTKLYRAKQLAAALAFIALGHSDRVRVLTLGSGPCPPPPAWRGRASYQRLAAHLESLEATGSGGLAASLRDFQARDPAPGIVVLISDLLDKQGYEQALRLLIARRMDVHVVQLLAAEELEPSLEGDVRLVDSEDGETIEITSNRALLERYRATLTAYVAELRQFCARREIGHSLVSNQEPVENIVRTHLRARGPVR